MSWEKSKLITPVMSVGFFFKCIGMFPSTQLQKLVKEKQKWINPIKKFGSDGRHQPRKAAKSYRIITKKEIDLLVQCFFYKTCKSRVRKGTGKASVLPL